MAEKLQKFSKTSTRPEKPAICPDCGIGFSRQPDISRHITPKITCPVKGCHKSFRKDKKHDFMSHVGREHPGLNSERANGYFKGTMPNWTEKTCHANAISQPIERLPFHFLACVCQRAPAEHPQSLTLSKHQHTSLSSRPCH